jgi:DUF917 family protein
MTIIDSTTIESLALGCAVLGTGGGGDIGPALLTAQLALKASGSVRVMARMDLPQDGLILPLSDIGAPTAALELLGTGDEALLLRDSVERETGKRVVAVMASEIGGANGVSGAIHAARLGLPLIDADGMGRAFPELQMISMNVARRPPGTIHLVDVLGNSARLDAADPAWAERWSRALCVASGGTATMADYVMTVEDAAGALVEGSVSLALRLGDAFATEEPLATLLDILHAEPLVRGVVDDVEQTTVGGFARGTVEIVGTGADDGRTVRVIVQNENLVATEGGRVLASVPDSIGLFDTATGIPISTESVQFGQRVTVLGWPCDPLWRSARGLAIAGPAAFGLETPYEELESIHGR